MKRMMHEQKSLLVNGRKEETKEKGEEKETKRPEKGEEEAEGKTNAPEEEY